MSFKESWPIPNLIRQLSGIEDPASLISDGICYAPPRNKTPKVAVIGAGPAGLCAARYLFAEDSGFTGVVFEQKDTIGGTWVYTDEIGKDKYGQPIHSPLYHGLISNLPKEVMEYTDFPYDIQDKSYLTSEEVLDYLNKYTDHFNLRQHIKFNHLVKRVSPVGKTWSLTALDLATNIEHVSLYDAVMVCSGPTSIPVYPLIEGLARFSGKQLHAKSFRRAEAYKGLRVLVIGLGPSGMDITYKLLPHAKQVILSHKFESLKHVTFPLSLIVKPAAASMSDSTVTFVDGTSEEVDVVIHCTGYTYNFPFLTKECGLVVNQYVSPLYLHLFNIEAPSLAVLGLPRIIPYYYCVEYQAKAFLAFLRGDAELPSQEEMMKITEDDIKGKLESGTRKKDIHRMGKLTKEYFESLQKLANLPPIPEVRYNIFFDAFKRVVADFEGFRYGHYKILDDENFEVEILERPEPPAEIEEVVVEAAREEEILDNGNGGLLEEIDENLKKEDEVPQELLEVESHVVEEESQGVKEESQCVENGIPELKTTESVETTVLSSEPLEVTSISTIQTAMTSSNDVVETVTESLEKLQKVETSTEVVETRTSGVVETISSGVIETSSELLETTTMEVVEERKVYTERRVEEIVIDGVNTMQVEAVVEKHERILNGEQLSETMKSHEDENVVKHR
uniref:Flavin-containing monooxygenase n=1 Tax=Lygus hesperus TaxID=30085 RepID=A0A0A9Y5J2_LYGHE